MKYVVFDIETTGLDPETTNIILIGVKDNRGYSKLLNAYGEDGEKRCIERFFELIKEVKTHENIIIEYEEEINNLEKQNDQKHEEIKKLNKSSFPDIYS